MAKRERAPKFDPDEPTVVVIAGAGARGSYEAGALAQVLPALFEKDLSKVMLIGTSAGAINAVLWGAGLDGRATAEVGEHVKSVWRSIGQEQVFKIASSGERFFQIFVRAGLGITEHLTHLGPVREAVVRATDALAVLVPEVTKNAVEAPFSLIASWTPWGRGAIENARNFAVGAAKKVTGTVAVVTKNAVQAPTVFASDLFKARREVIANKVRDGRALVGEIYGLLDTSPLQGTAQRAFDPAALKRNIDEGRLRGVGVVATSCPLDGSGGRSRVFYYAKEPLFPPPKPDDDSSIDYVLVEDGLQIEHVLASAAIPVVFSPIKVNAPADYAGWYTDGGVRLNTPIRPALDMGARQLVVISSLATSYPRKQTPTSERPNILDVAAQAIHTVLGDGTIEDLRSLHRVNRLVKQATLAKVKLKGDDGKPYVRVMALTVSPENGQLSKLANDQLQQAARGDWGYQILAQALGSAGDGQGHNELASYLLFHPEYVEAQIRLAEGDVEQKGVLKDAFVY